MSDQNIPVASKPKQHDAVSVDCRYCGRKAGIDCIQADSKNTSFPHQLRRDDFARLRNWNPKR